MRNRLFMVLAITVVLAGISAAVHAEKPFVWVDSSGGITDKVRIGAYLDDLKSHGVTGIRLPVNSSDGTVFYKKTTSALPVSTKLSTSQWASDDYLAYMISEASKRGIKIIAKVSGLNYSEWGKNLGWQKVDSKGAAQGKAFCVNSPFWEKDFFPMIKEVGANYDVAGFYFDPSQAAFGSSDACYCPACKARFEKETGKKLPAKSVDVANWTDPTVKLYAIKRVEWMNEFLDKYAAAIREAKPGAQVLLNTPGWGDTYEIGFSARHAGLVASAVMLKPTNLGDMFEPPITDEASLMSEKVMPNMTPYGYHEFVVKAAKADAPDKLLIASDAYPSTVTRQMDVQIGLIESAIGASARGYCLSSPLVESESAAWKSPKFVQYLKDLTTGERAAWIDDMNSDAKKAVLSDRDSEFWTGDVGRIGSVGGAFALLQNWEKTQIALLSTSDSPVPTSDRPRYKLTPAALAAYDIVICPGLEYVSGEDLQTLKDYANGGGKLLLMGGIAGNGKFLAESLTDDAFAKLGITTIGGAEPSGFLTPATKGPIFMVPGGFKGPMGTYRYSVDKNAVMSWKPKYDSDCQTLANEVTDTGKREAMLLKRMGSGDIGYINADRVSEFTPVAGRVFNNMVAVMATSTANIDSEGFSNLASVNSFKSLDGMTRYLYVVSSKVESRGRFVIRPYKGTHPVSAEIISDGGKPQPLKVVYTGDPGLMEMSVSRLGTATIKLPSINPPFTVLKIRYERTVQK